MAQLTDTQLADLRRSQIPWNVARRIFAAYAARLSILIEEGADDDTVNEVRTRSGKIMRLEFEAVAEIGRALGVLVNDLGVSKTERAMGLPDPAGFAKWAGASGTSAPVVGGNAGSAAGGTGSWGVGMASGGGSGGGSGGASGSGGSGPARKPPLDPENVG